MNCENSIVIRAPLETVFRTVADLESWPDRLPHYRWIRVLDRQNGTLTVQMAARRGRIPIHWTSRFEADPQAHELRFQHLRAFTKGMQVTWTFTPGPEGVRVQIAHQLPRTSTLGRWFAQHILAALFIQPVATQTLRHFKQLLEQPSEPAVRNCEHHV